MNKDLVICPVGDHSFHQAWLKPGRGFDVLLIYYGYQPGRYRGEAEYYIECYELGKMSKIYHAINHFKKEMARYEFIALADDDLITTEKAFNLLFSKFRQYGLDAAQPAIDNGFVSYPLTTRHLDCELRYVNFIETMCPTFSGPLLLNDLLPTLVVNKSSWGLDFLWAQILRGKKIAFLDSVPMAHKGFFSSVRALFSYEQGPYYRALRDAGISEIKEMEEVVAKIDPEVMRTMYAENARISRPLSQRIFLWPLVAWDHARWAAFFWFRKYLPKICIRLQKMTDGAAKTKESFS